jgi:glycerophosphoryl diester phosphodiesterase
MTSYICIYLCCKLAQFARALRNKDGVQFPQAIAHRGYKAKFPENTMAAFKGAIDVGAHALETDIHITKDGVAVLSHVSYLKSN